MSWGGGRKVASGWWPAPATRPSAHDGRVGSDDYGQFCIRDFERHGIDVSGMKVREGSTSLSIVLQRPGDQRQEHRVPAGHGPAAQLPRSWTRAFGGLPVVFC